ncbi:MAG TPA: hypothetical protein VFA03_05845 [Acetobacteraceae bacterium]|nr:hypothetical protein [Acetobacteraceae bacterium]
MAELVPFEPVAPRAQRRIGFRKRQVKVTDDFDHDMAGEILELFVLKDE